MSESSSCTNDCVNKNIQGNGFIAPNGTFYKVTMRGEDLLDNNSDFIIEQAAKEILNIDLIKYYMEQELKHPDYRDKKLSSIDILVYVLGFVIYNYTKENGLEIMYPKEIEFIKIFGKKLTDNQIEKILKLVSENNDSYDAMCDAFSDSNKRSNMAMMKKVI